MIRKSVQLPLVIVACRMRDLLDELLASGKHLDSYGLAVEHTECLICDGKDNVYSMAVVASGTVETVFCYCGHCNWAYAFEIPVGDVR